MKETPLVDVSAIFTDKFGIAHGLQLILPNTDSSIQNLFVYSDIISEIVSFFQALRRAKFYLLRSAYPDETPESLLLYKFGNKQTFLSKFGFLD